MHAAAVSTAVRADGSPQRRRRPVDTVTSTTTQKMIGAEYRDDQALRSPCLDPASCGWRGCRSRSPRSRGSCPSRTRAPPRAPDRGRGRGSRGSRAPWCPVRPGMRRPISNPAMPATMGVTTAATIERIRARMPRSPDFFGSVAGGGRSRRGTGSRRPAPDRRREGAW